MLRNKRGVTPAGLIVVLIIILAIGFGIYRLFFTTKPLKIKDLEDIYIVTTRSSVESGWAITADCGSGTKDGGFGEVIDNSNEYHDANSFKNPQRLVGIVVNQDRDIAEGEKVNIQAGDMIELTYDGGRRLLLYLPRITQEDLDEFDEFELYVAPDGSTYYDKKLTQLAQSTP